MTMLPRLQAEEQLATVNAMFATEGRSMKDGDQVRFLDRMERIATGQMERKPPANPQAWAEMGIKVNLEPGPKRRRRLDEQGGEGAG